jgi:hypothetical protein
VPYWDVVDIITFPSQPLARRDWLRIGYYRKKPGEPLRWGSQTTITEPLDIWKQLLIKAGKEMGPFGKLLREVVTELEK